MNDQVLKEVIYSLSRRDCFWIVLSFLLFFIFNVYITKWILNESFELSRKKDRKTNFGTKNKVNSSVNQKLNTHLKKKIRNEELARKQVANAKQARNQRREAKEAKQRLKEVKQELYEKKINKKVLERIAERSEDLKREQKEQEKWRLEIEINEAGNEFEFEDESLNDEYINLKNFINAITLGKTTNVNDLSVEFKISIEDVISRIHQLEEQKIIDGVLTDKGHYIFINQQEWKSIQLSIEREGKISKSKDLVSICNNAIELQPLRAIQKSPPPTEDDSAP